MTNDNGFTMGRKRPEASGRVDPAEAARDIAARLRAVEKEVALLCEEVLDLPTVAPAQTSVPVLAYTYAQVGEAIGLGRTTISGMVGRGLLPMIKVNGVPRVHVADLEAYLESLREQR